ncbi:MAG TPA: hypothetical protein PLD88_14135 [Candidatus Berkiella sp.]|nr:hypothetical protein [Candidatus Berkiella sp.]
MEYGTQAIDLFKIDTRISRGRYIMETHPSQEDIMIPIKHFDEITEKLMKNAKFRKCNPDFFAKKVKTKARV